MPNFTSYVATSKFNISIDRDNVLTLLRNDSLLFDGDTVIFDGREYHLPKMSVAIRSGWLTPSDNPVAFQPTKAAIKISAATPEQEDGVMSHVLVSEDEKVVGNLTSLKPKILEPRAPKTGVGASASESLVEMDRNPRGTAQSKRDSVALKPMPVISDSEGQVKVLSTQFKTAAKNVSTVSPKSTMLGTTPSKQVEEPTQAQAQAQAKVEWNKSLHWSKKLSLIESTYLTDTQALREIHAMESPKMQARIEKLNPNAF